MDQTTKLKPLTPEALYRRSNIQNFTFNTTADLDGLTEFVGHLRALQAVQFGIGIRSRGFNLYLLGPVGTGKYVIARSFLEKKAATEATPDEWVYVNNFASPEAPRTLKLPPGRGVLLREDMRRLMDNLRSAIPSAFQTENYQARKQAIEQEMKPGGAGRNCCEPAG